MTKIKYDLKYRGPCVDGPWKGDEVAGDEPMIEVPMFEGKTMAGWMEGAVYGRYDFRNVQWYWTPPQVIG